MSVQLTSQRISDIRAFLARHRITLKDVCKRANLNYNSVKTAFHRVGTKGDDEAISSDRLATIEQAAIDMQSERNKAEKEVA